MFKALKRWWKYVTAKTGSALDERADPKVQLEQAIGEAQNQHRVLMEQAANVIAQQKTTELQLNRKMAELEKVNGNTRQAVIMADRASNDNDSAKATEYAKAAESFANRLVGLEHEIDDLKSMALQATQASDQAKTAVTQNGQLLQQKLSERQKLLGQLEQAKMQESMNRAMTSLSETVGQDVPTLDQVRDKIEIRYAKAKGISEVSGGTVESRMLEIEQAARNTDAQDRLSAIRLELGLAGAEGSAAGQVTGSNAGEVGPGPADVAPDAVGSAAEQAALDKES